MFGIKKANDRNNQGVRFGRITDGTSKTLAIGEFVHRDFVGGTFNNWPGNVRAWVRGDNGNNGSYAFKIVAKYGINQVVERTAAQGNQENEFNHLPFGSSHGTVRTLQWVMAAHSS